VLWVTTLLDNLPKKIVFKKRQFSAVRLIHSMNIDCGYFLVSIPEKIQLEYCFKSKILADYLMTFHNDAGIMKAMTGIRETLIPDWYYGDQRSFFDGDTITSLVLIQFSPDRSIFRLYLFDGYYPEGRKKKNEIIRVIREISATGTAPIEIMNKLRNHIIYKKS
jgi:hypothetical protein